VETADGTEKGKRQT